MVSASVYNVRIANTMLYGVLFVGGAYTELSYDEL